MDSVTGLVYRVKGWESLLSGYGVSFWGGENFGDLDIGNSSEP
jgi:hypothetical protein